MASPYPGAFDALTNPTGSDSMATVSHAGQHDAANDAIEAVEATLGINPQGGEATVAARLAAITSISTHASLPDIATSGHPGTAVTIDGTGTAYLTPSDDATSAAVALDAAIQSHTHTTLHASLSDLSASGHPASVVSVNNSGMAFVTHTNAQQAIADLDAAIVVGGTGDLFVRLTSDEISVNNSTTLVDTALSVSAAASSVYFVYGTVIYDSSQVADIRFHWTGPASAAFDWSASALVTGATGATGNIDRQARTLTSTPGYGGAAVGTNVTAVLTGLLVTAGTSGAFKLQYAQNTLEATNTTVRAGSFMYLRKVA